MYYNDNGEIKPINVKASDTLPIGTIVGYSSLNAPSGWLICDGSEVSRTTYSKLFEVIGTTYGSGDGSTTFNLPNYKGKVAVGYNSSETEFDTLGETGGEKTHTLTIEEIPRHNHTTYCGGNPDYASAPVATGPQGWSGYQTPSSYVGEDKEHNNLQPYIVQTYIIKYEQSVGMIGNVKNESVTSSQDTYSCDYINEYTEYENFKTLRQGVKYRKVGKIVEVSIGATWDSTVIPGFSELEVELLPVGYRPPIDETFYIFVRNDSSGEIYSQCRIVVKTNGKITVFNWGNQITANNFYSSFSFAI